VKKKKGGNRKKTSTTHEERRGWVFKGVREKQGDAAEGPGKEPPLGRKKRSTFDESRREKGGQKFDGSRNVERGYGKF